MQSGDLGKVHEAVQGIYNEQIGKPAGMKAAQAVEVETAAKKAQAEVPARIAGEVGAAKAKAALSGGAFANIIDEVQRNRQIAENDKNTQAYTDKLNASQQLVSTIDAAQKGNKAAPGLVAIQELRGFLNRLNATELKSVSSAAGSIADRVQGKISGLTAGEPIPANVLQDMKALAVIQQQAAKRAYDAGLQRLKTNGVDITKIPDPLVSMHQVGDVVNLNGKKLRITKIDPDGTFDGEPVKEGQ
jgi:hypothetical protein